MGSRTGLIVGLLMLLAATAQARTFKVTTHLDVNDHACTPSKCSLRDAIIASNMSLGANTIKLRAGHYKLTIPGTREHAAATGDLNITNHVTIDGAGASTTTIDGNHIDRVFETFGGAKLTLSGVTVTGGAAVAQTPGSAVEGGAVLDDGGGPVTITNAAITGNTAAGSSGGAGGYGGAIDVEPPSNVAISLTNTTLSGNQAGGSSTADSGHGGAIDNQGPGTITLNHVSMTGNHAGGHQAGGYGGAANTEGPLVVSASTFTDNTAGGDGHFGYGGALDASTVTSTDSTFRGNDAGGGGASGDGHGGALELGVSATLTRSAIADNRAGGGGDGTGFGAFGYGGGVDAVSGAVTLSNSTVIGNSAGGGDQNSYGFGGGVDAALTATGSTIANNKVGGGDGFGDGGGIYGELTGQHADQQHGEWKQRRGWGRRRLWQRWRDRPARGNRDADVQRRGREHSDCGVEHRRWRWGPRHGDQPGLDHRRQHLGDGRQLRRGPDLPGPQPRERPQLSLHRGRRCGRCGASRAAPEQWWPHADPCAAGRTGDQRW